MDDFEIHWNYDVAIETDKKYQKFENSSKMYKTLQKYCLANIDVTINFGISKMAVVTMETKQKYRNAQNLLQPYKNGKPQT